MSGIFRKVMCSDRLPKERKWFDTDKGYLLFSITQNQWLVSDEYYPKWWLEEIELPSGAFKFVNAQSSDYHLGYNHGVDAVMEFIKGQ